MVEPQLVDEIASKGSDKEALAERAASMPGGIALLLEGMRAKAAAVKFGCEKILRLASEKHPERVYPAFDEIAEFLDSDNKILRWGAIFTLSNLAGVDSGGRFTRLFPRYYRAITGGDMVAAASAIKGSVKIARARPDLAERIKDEILEVARATYKTPECRNVVIGEAIGALEAFYDLIGDKDAVIRFVKRQLRNSRKKVALDAERFLKRAGVVKRAPRARKK